MENNAEKHIGEMTTLSEVINRLVIEGYTIDFNVKDDKNRNPLMASPELFVIDRHYRFEGESDPEDEAIVYAISSVDTTLKGIFVSGYGISSTTEDEEIIGNLKVRSS